MAESPDPDRSLESSDLSHAMQSASRENSGTEALSNIRSSWDSSNCDPTEGIISVSFSNSAKLSFSKYWKVIAVLVFNSIRNIIKSFTRSYNQFKDSTNKSELGY